MQKPFFTIAMLLIVCSLLLSRTNCAKADVIPSLVSEVSGDELFDTLTFLTSYSSRSSYQTQEEVLAYIAATLDEAGTVTRLHEYDYGGQTWHNLIATVPSDASLDPGEPHLIVGSHIDSVAAGPGADDNASGVAAVMEAARVLAGAGLSTRVDFVFFTQEERGGIGSANYAADARAAGETIEAMIAVDMVAFGSAGEDLEIVTKPTMAWLAEAFKNASDTYTGSNTRLVLDWACG
jgi:acetylornithine deacetylase/succinyl-diaminopimelate desuccinylase-like protein